MFEPVSALAYQHLNKDAQALVVCAAGADPDAVRVKWGARAAAALADDACELQAVVRDLLANPHIRVVVFDGAPRGRDAWVAVWRGDALPAWPIQREHVQLVRQFVDLYDDDFLIKTVLPPYWPARIRYADAGGPR